MKSEIYTHTHFLFPKSKVQKFCTKNFCTKKLCTKSFVLRLNHNGVRNNKKAGRRGLSKHVCVCVCVYEYL